jgi:hypothetical protein
MNEDSREAREDVTSGSRTARDVELQLAEIRGFVKAMAIVAEQNLERLDEIARRAA